MGISKKPFDIRRIVKFAFHLQSWDFVYFIKRADGSWQGEYEGDTWDASKYSFNIEYAILSEG